MKKVLFASTILASLGTVAAAQDAGVTISGYGRFGLMYDSTDKFVERIDSDGVPYVAKANETLIHHRLRFNIDAKTQTDSGVGFGGRVRMQDSDQGSATLNAAQLYTTWEGLRVEVGNSNQAQDTIALQQDSQMGLRASSFGDSRSSMFIYSSGPYDAARTGLYAAYTFAEFTVLGSYITPDQIADADVTEEVSVAAAYETDLFTVAVAGTWDGAGIEDNDIWFIGAAYNISDVATVGINYFNEGWVTPFNDGVALETEKDSSTVTVYGKYTFDAVTLQAYVAHNDLDWDNKTAYGLGAAYDLGGARLLGSVQRSYQSETYADFGVRFEF